MVGKKKNNKKASVCDAQSSTLILNTSSNDAESLHGHFYCEKVFFSAVMINGEISYGISPDVLISLELQAVGLTSNNVKM